MFGEAFPQVPFCWGELRVGGDEKDTPSNEVLRHLENDPELLCFDRRVLKYQKHALWSCQVKARCMTEYGLDTHK